MARGAGLALLAAPLLLAAGAASAGPMLSGNRGDAPIWEEHGAGRTDGLSVGAYPLPPQPEQGSGADGEIDGGAKERWLRRHYQWLRALGEVLSNSEPEANRRAAAQPGGQAAFARPDPQGAVRVGDMVVLYADADAERIAPHLLDDGARYEDPEVGLSRGEALDFIVSDRLTIETAKVVAEYFGPLARGFRNSFGVARAESGRPRALRYDPIQFDHPSFAMPSGEIASGAPARQHRPAERVSMLGFFKGIALDIVSAPTTYLLTLLALLGWLILRATVFSRS